MSLVFYKRGRDFLEEKVECLQLGLVGLQPGRAVVFGAKHILDERKKSMYARNVALDLPRPTFLTVASVDPLSITFWKGSTKDTLTVPVQAVLEDCFNGAFYDVQEWYEWQEQRTWNDKSILEEQLTRLQRDKDLLMTVLTSQTTVITKEQAQALGIKV